MTDEQAGSAEDVAKAEHIIEWWTTQLDHGMEVHGDDLQTLTKGIARALAARERAVWEKFVREIEKNETVSLFIGPLWNAGWTERSQSLLTWARQQAER